MENLNELKSAYEWGKEAIQQMKDRGEQVPTFVYERMIELADKIMKAEKQ